MKETKAGSTLYRTALRVDVKKYPVQYEHSLIKGSGHAIVSIFCLTYIRIKNCLKQYKKQGNVNKEHRWAKTLDCISVKLEESGQGILQICYVASNNLAIKSVSFFSNLTSTLMLRCPFKHTLRLLLNFSLLFHEVLTPVYN